MFAAAIKAAGGLDVVVNNAGLGGTAGRRHDRRRVERVLDVTSTAPSGAPAPRPAHVLRRWEQS